MKEKYETLSTWKFLLKEGWAYSHTMILMILGEGMINAVSGYAAVLLPAFIIADLERGTELKIAVVKIFLYFSVIAVLSIMGEAASNRNMNQMIQFRTHYMPEVMEQCMDSDYETYVKEESQVMLEKGMSAIGTNSRGIEGFYHHFTVLLTCIMELVIYSGLIGRLSLWMVVTVIGLSVLSYLMKDVFNRKYSKTHQMEAENEVHIRYFSTLPYNIATGKDIRLYQMQNMLKNRFAKYNREKIKNTDQTERNLCESNIVTAAITFIKDAICYGFLIYAMMKGNMEVSAFVLYIGSFSSFSREFGKLSDCLSLISVDISLAGDYRKLKDILKTVNGTEKIAGDVMDVQFDHVYFRYGENEHWILEDFSLHIHPHEKLALVGVNGAGKTTVVKLLCRLLHPEKGRILINGVDLEKYDFNDYRKKVGFVFQNTEPFEFSVGTNISGELEGNYDEKKVKEALGKAGLTERIHTLKDDIHTSIGNVLDKDGIMLSGGEVQKLMLARAYYHNPSFMILDEPTAAMDAISEQEMYQSYLSFIGDHNALFISHRLASTRFCNRIVLLENGKIVEEGTHEELMNENGKYREMFDVQAKYYRKGKTNEEIIA